MPFLNNLFTSLRTVTHGTAQTSIGASVCPPLPAPMDAEIHAHGTDPDWTRREIAKAEAQDAKLFAQIQFNEESA